MSILARGTKVTMVLATAAAVSFGCVAQTDTPDSAEPELPPVASLKADIDVLKSAPAVAKAAPTGPSALPSEHTNFATAWLSVGIIELYSVALVALPSLAIGAALLQPAEFDGDKWLWTVTALGSTVDLEVSASAAEGWDVDLFVTNAQLSRFLWVEGNSTLDVTHGTWRINDAKLPAGADKALEITWDYVSDTDRSLEYKDVRIGHENEGDTMVFSIDGTDAAVTFTDVSDDSRNAQIAWDTGMGNGSIQAPNYNAGKKACWDTEFVNTVCAD